MSTDRMGGAAGAAEAHTHRSPATPSTVPLPEGLPAFLKLVAEPNRLRILAFLAAGERCVCDIEAALGVPQNLVSHHLAALRRAGLLRDRREGKWVYYRLDPILIEARLGALGSLLELRHPERRALPCPEEDR